VSIAFWSKLTPVDFYRDVAACLIFIPCTTYPAKGPYEFAVSGAGDDYIDLANTYPFVEAQIMDDDDTALDGGADVGYPSVVFPSSVQTCFGPSMLSGT
jgi:hypothetical protein